jgi:hypothetical protein
VFSTKLPADDAPPKPTWARAPDRATPKPVRFEIEPDIAPEPSTAAETDARVPAARRPTIHYVVAGLGLLCFVESLVIAGLLTRQPGAPTAAPTAGSTSATTARAVVPAVDTAPPAATRPAPSPAPRQQAANVPAAPAATATPPPTLTRGWLTIETPFDLEVFEGGTSLGSTTGGALSLLAGPHDLRLVNSTLNYETGIRVEIPAGVGITTRIASPNGTLSLNAMPWANVSLNGKSLGTTPLMNLSVPVGSHEITWRHPQLGERKQLAIVTARGPVTLVMDFYK